MKVEHVNLVVNDLTETLAFYQAAFPHWSVRGQGQQDWYGTHRRWLHFGDDFNYLTFNDQGTGNNRDLSSSQLGLAHIGFETKNLDAIVQRLHQAGFSKQKSGVEGNHRKNAYFIDPNGFEIEFVEYLSDLPQERNQYDG